MKKSMVLLLLLSFALVVGGTASAGWVEKKEPIMKDQRWTYLLAYKDYLLFRAGEKINLYNISTGKRGALPFSSLPLDMYESRIVFNENKEIFMYSIKEKRRIRIGTGDTPPSVFSNFVVYGEEGEIVLYDLNKKKEKRIHPSGEMLYSNDIGPIIYRDTVVWIEVTKDGRGILNSFDIKKGSTKKLLEISADDLSVPSTVKVLKIQDGIVLLSNKTDVYIYNTFKGSFKRLAKPGKRVFLSNINKGKVVWDSDGGDTVHFYDIARDEYSELVAKGSEIYSVANSDREIFFIDHGKYELRMFKFKAD